MADMDTYDEQRGYEGNYTHAQGGYYGHSENIHTPHITMIYIYSSLA